MKKFYLLNLIILLAIVISCEKEDSNSNKVKDIDGNLYKTVEIGTQTWMAENLKTTHYSNGDPIPHVKDNYEWDDLETGAYCYYNNDEGTYAHTYGALYNWYTVDDNRNVCPDGWHIPTKAEWNILIDFLGGSQEAGGKMKETGIIHWKDPNTDATNESGFTAVPGGFRLEGAFGFLKSYGYWWSNTVYDGIAVNIISLRSQSAEVGFRIGNKWNGLSIRCVKD